MEDFYFSLLSSSYILNDFICHNSISIRSNSYQT
nr:MAG TPA: hypothetical protein [Caudoviricetes sp.]